MFDPYDTSDGVLFTHHPYANGRKFVAGGDSYQVGAFILNSTRQTGFQNLKFSNNETRPNSKFFSLLIYAGYPA